MMTCLCDHSASVVQLTKKIDEFIWNRDVLSFLRNKLRCRWIGLAWGPFGWRFMNIFVVESYLGSKDTSRQCEKLDAVNLQRP